MEAFSYCSYDLEDMRISPRLAIHRDDGHLHDVGLDDYMPAPPVQLSPDPITQPPVIDLTADDFRSPSPEKASSEDESIPEDPLPPRRSTRLSYRQNEVKKEHDELDPPEVISQITDILLRDTRKPRLSLEPPWKPKPLAKPRRHSIGPGYKPLLELGAQNRQYSNKKKIRGNEAIVRTVRQSSRKSARSERMSQFSVGNLVWAKMKGFPPWPGIIKNPPSTLKGPKSKKPDLHCVYFFGSKNYGWIEESCIKLYEHNNDDMKRAVKSPAFLIAVKEMEDYMNNPDNKDEIFEKLREGMSQKRASNSESKKRNSSEGNETIISSDESSADEAVEDSTPSKSKATPKKRKSSDAIKDRKSGTPRISLPKKAKLSKKESISKKESMKRQSSSSKPETKHKKTSTPNCDYDIDVDDRSPPSHETFNGNFSYTPKHLKHIPYYTAAPLPPMVSRAIPEPAPFDVHYVSDIVKKKTIVPSGLTFGFLGTGAIGSGVIKNLVHTKHKVVIWNRSTDKSEPFKKLGVDILQTPSDVVGAADITFCCVADDKAAKSLVFGNCGVGSEMKPNKAYVEMSGIGPEDSLDIFEDISSRGGKYLELRFVGSRKEAEDGSLVLVAAGDSSVFRDCDSCFKAMGIYTKFLGSEIGHAARFASVVNVMVGVTIGGLAEAMALAERIGIEKKEVAAFVKNSQLSSDIVNATCEAIIKNDFSTNMSLGAMQKNIRLALNLGDKFYQRLPITATTNEVLVHTKKLGYKQYDSAAAYLGTKM